MSAWGAPENHITAARQVFATAVHQGDRTVGPALPG
jgi:hypothetical protein